MTAPERRALHPRPTAPCNRCHADLSWIDRQDGLRCDSCTDAAYRRLITELTPLPASAPPARPRALVLPVFLLVLIGCLAFWLGLVLLGQQALCALHDGGLRYCAGYSAVQQ